MAAHLARHMSGSHGVAPAGGAAVTNSGPRVGKKRGPKPGRRRGRMPAAVAGLKLSLMSAEQLGQVMVAARQEIEQRIRNLQEAIR
ncbi:MAG TPA: hypothetical protein VNT79_11710 [Phycisphaerae bacterium]|nr:hypothetical protein [Phycisphaerae bacterium]